MNSSKEDITGKILADKVGRLLSDHKLKISVDQFQDLCNKPSAQSFLKWFCQHVGPDNVLSKEEIQKNKSLKESNAWLSGDKLDSALASTLKDHPELESLVQENVNCEAELFKAYEAEKEAYKEDLEYLSSVDCSLKKLKELDSKQDEDLKPEKTKLEKLEITNFKVYDDCLLITEEYDRTLSELDLFLGQTLNALSDVTNKRGPVICWNQVPLDMYIKQIDTYKSYLEFYIEKNSSLFKKYFPENLPVVDGTDNSSELNSIDSFMETELQHSETKLTNALSKKIDSEINRCTADAVMKRAIEIHNNGSINFPKTDSQLMSEITNLTAKRNILLQNNELLEQELKNCIDTYSQIVVTKVLVDIHEFQMIEKNKQLKQLKDISCITRDLGHSHSDLLSLLMQTQLRTLTNLRKIIPEAKRYLETIYQQSSQRCEYLENLQAQYSTIDQSSPCEKNIYNKLFLQLVSGDTNSKNSFDSSLNLYNDIVAENISLKEEFLKNTYNNPLQYLQALEKQVIIMYDHELNSGQTRSFKLMPNELTAEFENVLKCIEENQNNFNQMRKKFKILLDKISQDLSEREKEILWQKFLADPEGLKSRYDQLQNELNRAHFRNTSFMNEQ